MQRPAFGGRIKYVDPRDPAAFEALLAPVVVDAHRLATALLNDPGLAEDAVQEAAVKAWRKFDSFREGAEFRPWFLAVVANQARDMARARRRRPWLSMPSSVHSRSSVADEVVDRSSLRSALATLDRRDRLVLVLHYYLGLPWSEVAVIAGLNEATARSRAHRALRRLRPPANAREVTT